MLLTDSLPLRPPLQSTETGIPSTARTVYWHTPFPLALAFREMPTSTTTSCGRWAKASVRSSIRPHLRSPNRVPIPFSYTGLWPAALTLASFLQWSPLTLEMQMVPHVTFPSPSRDAPIWPAPRMAARTASLGVARQLTTTQTENLVSAPVRVSMHWGVESRAHPESSFPIPLCH